MKYGAGGSGLGPLVCLVYLYTDNDSLAAKRYRDSLMSWQVPDTEKLSLTPLLLLCSPGGILQTYCQYLILRLAPTPAQSRVSTPEDLEAARSVVSLYRIQSRLGAIYFDNCKLLNESLD